MPDQTHLDPVDDFDDWTVADDAFLRAGLASLREDLDPHAMPEPALVRARATRSPGRTTTGRRRGAWTIAAVAAAAAVAVAVVWNPLAGKGGTDAVPGTTAPTASTSLPSTAAAPGPMPGAQAWRTALAVPGLPIVDSQLGAEDSTVGALCSGFPDLGRVADSERVYTRAGQPDDSLIGTQARFPVTNPEQGLGRIADAFASCSPTTMASVPNPDPGAGETDPMVWSYTADGKQGFVAAAQGRGGVTLIEIPDVTATGMNATADGVRALAVVAQTRLDATAAGSTSASATSATTSTSACGAVSGVTAGLDTTGVNAAQRAKATKLADAVAACDTASLTSILTTDQSVVSRGVLTVDQVLALPANQDRYEALATVLTMKPGTQFGLATWPTEPTTDADWAAFVGSGLYTQGEVDQMRPNGYTGWKVVIDATGKVTAFVAGD